MLEKEGGVGSKNRPRRAQASGLQKGNRDFEPASLQVMRSQCPEGKNNLKLWGRTVKEGRRRGSEKRAEWCF